MPFPQFVNDAPLLDPGLVNFGGSIDGLTLDASGQTHNYDADPWGTSNNGPSAGLYGVNPPFAVNNQLRGLIIPDPTLRRQTVVAMVVSGDVCPASGGLSAQLPGRIEAGQLLRVAALGHTETSGLVGGNINAHLIADARDNFLGYSVCTPPAIGNPQFTGFKAVETVTAAKAVRGQIVAQGRARDDSLNLYERDLLNPAEVIPCPTIIAQHPDYYPLWIERGSIQNVLVSDISTPNLGGGIGNHILAPLGRIYSIRSTGPIRLYAGGGKVDIKAGDGVHETRIINPIDGKVLDHRLNADIDARQAVQRVGYAGAAPSSLSNNLIAAAQQGCVYLVETKGRANLTISCDNMVDPLSGKADPAPINLAASTTNRDALGRCGVFVYSEDDWYQPPESRDFSIINITVNHLAYNVSMIAPTFETVEIGKQLRGSIVAFGLDGPVGSDNYFTRAYGFIHSLKVGLKLYQQDADPYPSLNRGFVGGNCAPVQMQPASVGTHWNDPTLPTELRRGNGIRMDYDGDRFLYYAPTNPSQDKGSIDSVIRAEFEIDKSQIHSMSQWADTELGYENKFPYFLPVSPAGLYKPRLESRHIGQLVICGLEPPAPQAVEAKEWTEAGGGIWSGVIWSGVMRYPGNGSTPFIDDPAHNPAYPQDTQAANRSQGRYGGDLEDAYANVYQRVDIARVESPADIWMVTILTSRLSTIYGDCNGEVHLAEMGDRGGEFLIGGALGDMSRSPFGDVSHPSSASEEQTPRGRAWLAPGPSASAREPHVAPIGGLYVARDKAVENTDPLIQERFHDGCISINAAVRDPRASSTDPADWIGRVRCGDPWFLTPGHDFTLGPVGVAGTPMDVAPEYERGTEAFTLYGDTGIPGFRGGAVGVVPYAVHDESCQPPNIPDMWQSHGRSLRDFAWVNETAIPSPLVRFYGAIQESLGTAGDPPDVRIDRISTTSANPQWQDATPKMRTYIYHNVISELQRDLAIVPRCDVTDLMAGIYRVQRMEPDYEASPPNLGHLLCWYKATRELISVAAFTYYFRVYAAADIGTQGGLPGSDGFIDNNDLVVFVNLFFTNDPLADVGIQGGFYGSDGAWDNNDFVVYINMFFGGDDYGIPVTCGSGISGSPGGSGQQGAARPSIPLGSPAGEQSGDAVVSQRAAALRASLLVAIQSLPEGQRRDMLQQLLQQLDTGGLTPATTPSPANPTPDSP